MIKKIEILFKNLLVRILLLVKSRNKKSIPQFNSSSKLLFIRLNRIGDALVVTPLLHEIKKSLKCKIDLLADRKNHFVFINNDDIDKIIIFEKGLKGFRDVLRLIKTEQYDAVIDLHDDVSATVTYLLALCSAKNIFGLRKSNSAVYTQTVERLDSTSHHVIERNLELAKLFNIEVDKSRTNVRYIPKAESLKKVNDILKRRYTPDKFLIGINISAGSEARFWGVDKFKTIIASIEKRDINFIVLCTTRDINLALKITNDQNKIYYTPSFDEFAAMISKLDLLFTPDTSTVHLASVFNIPVFGIYVQYNTNDIIWSPYQSDFDYVVTKEPTLENVTSESVLNKFIPFLEKHMVLHGNSKL